jgi:hypothetical protein
MNRVAFFLPIYFQSRAAEPAGGKYNSGLRASAKPKIHRRASRQSAGNLSKMKLWLSAEGRYMLLLLI